MFAGWCGAQFIGDHFGSLQVCICACARVRACVCKVMHLAENECELKHFVNAHHSDRCLTIRNKNGAWWNTTILSASLWCPLQCVTGWNWVFSQCASSCCCIAEGSQAPSYCVWQAQNPSICLQETHTKLLLPSLGARFGLVCCTNNQQQQSFLNGIRPGIFARDAAVRLRPITRFVASERIATLTTVGLRGSKSERFILTVMRFLQDLISDRRRQRDWTNPCSLVPSGIPASVIPATGNGLVSLRSDWCPASCCKAEKLKGLREGTRHLCPFSQVKMWKCSSCSNILSASALSNHRWAQTHASRPTHSQPPSSSFPFT